MIKPQTLKGFRDFLPGDAIKRQFIIDKIKKVFELFGFDPIETPALEYAETLLGKYGEEADKLLYLFKDRGERNVGLKYDQTVPLARVIAQYPDIPKPFKRYQIQPVWRAENPQKGRYREFLQCDADIIGDNFPPTADSEILSLFWSIYSNLGFKSFRINANSRTLLRHLITTAFANETNKFSDQKVLSIIRTLDKLSKIGKDGVSSELSSKGISSQIIHSLIQAIDKLNKLRYKDLEDIDCNFYYSLQMAIENFKVPEDAINIDPTLARGLDYYTGLIFEGLESNYKSSLGGGGRYDNLVGQFAGYGIPAVGFAIGFDRTLEAAESLKLLPAIHTKTKVILAVIEDWKQVFPAALNLVTKLRSLSINTELYLNPQEKLIKQLKYADKKGIPYVVIIGPEEVKQNKIKLKNMVKHTETLTDENELIKIIHNS